MTTVTNNLISPVPPFSPSPTADTGQKPQPKLGGEALVPAAQGIPGLEAKSAQQPPSGGIALGGSVSDSSFPQTLGKTLQEMAETLAMSSDLPMHVDLDDEPPATPLETKLPKYTAALRGAAQNPQLASLLGTMQTIGSLFNKYQEALNKVAEAESKSEIAQAKKPLPTLLKDIEAQKQKALVTLAGLGVHAPEAISH